MNIPIYIGWDPHEMMAWNIAATSIRNNARVYPDIRRLSLSELQMNGRYTRETTHRDGQLYDVVSDAPMSTEHAIARFFVPLLRDYQGWALFTDGDILCRRAIDDLFALTRDADHFAVMCVQHPPMQATNDQVIKKDGAPQHFYARKNWSSVMLWNCGHPANRSLNTHALNNLPGRDLHRFCWLADYEIGELPLEWNWLAGVSEPLLDPAIVHFTLGTPNLPYARASAYDAEWIQFARTAGYRDVRVGYGVSAGGVA
jgi:lipopolysaccharide biosynthesis glycosyltransferase